MEKDYEYHKQNNYPGERLAEKERVSDKAEAAEIKSDARVAEKGRTEGLKADNRVARRGRMDDALMDSEIERSTARAKDVNSNRNSRDMVGMFVIAGLVFVLLAGFVWGFMAIRQQSEKISSLNMQLANSVTGKVAANPITNSVLLAADITRPTIVQVSPVNDKLSVETHDQIIVKFSEPMDAKTINGNTFTVFQRTTPLNGSPSADYRTLQVEGVVTYKGLIATFTPKNLQPNPLQPSQKYGNVFTAEITTGARDLAGNSLSRNYMWSFTTGAYQFYRDATTSQTG